MTDFTDDRRATDRWPEDRIDGGPLIAVALQTAQAPLGVCLVNTSDATARADMAESAEVAVPRTDHRAHIGNEAVAYHAIRILGMIPVDTLGSRGVHLLAMAHDTAVPIRMNLHGTRLGRLRIMAGVAALIPGSDRTEECARNAGDVAAVALVTMDRDQVGSAILAQVTVAAISCGLGVRPVETGETICMHMTGRAVLAVMMRLAAWCDTIVLVMAGQRVAGVADVFGVDRVPVVEVADVHEHDVVVDDLLHQRIASGVVDHVDGRTDVPLEVTDVLAALDVRQPPAVLVVAHRALQRVVEPGRARDRVRVQARHRRRVVAGRTEDAGQASRVE